MRPLFSDRRHLDGSHTHPKSGLRAESVFLYPCSDAHPSPRSSSLGPVEGAVPLPRARLQEAREGHLLDSVRLPQILRPENRTAERAPRVPYPSVTDKFHSRLLLWLRFPLPITHIHSSLYPSCCL